ncbi:hypothetical protein Tco_1243565, partial [Tanacetum coccineum]
VAQEEGVLSKVLPCQLLPKELNPGSFTLSCIIGSLNFYDMVDLGHIDVSEPVKKSILKSWLIDCFREELVKDPRSRSLDDYKWMFDLEIDQLADEYELGIGKKGHMLDDIWENCNLSSDLRGYEFAQDTLIKSLSLAIIIRNAEQCSREFLLSDHPENETLRLVRELSDFDLLFVRCSALMVSNIRRIQALEQETRDLDVEIKQMKDLKVSYGVTTPHELCRNQIKEEMRQHHDYVITA